jgi:hypothetical protein
MGGPDGNPSSEKTADKKRLARRALDFFHPMTHHSIQIDRARYHLYANDPSQERSYNTSDRFVVLLRKISP